MAAMEEIRAPPVNSIPHAAMQLLLNQAGQLMVAPVLLENGRTYDRADVMAGPMVTNFAIKHIIDAITAGDQELLDLALTCTISGDFFADPVICTGDGHTYSKKDLETWFTRTRAAGVPLTMTSPMTQQPCGQHIPNQTLVDFMENCGMRPMRPVGVATKKHLAVTLLAIASRMNDRTPGARQYSHELKQLVHMYLDNQIRFFASSDSRPALDTARRILKAQLGGYKSKSKLNKHKHSRSHKHSRKRA